MNWIDAIEEIKNAHSNNRLVIFVGAGVSANSKLPTWKNLIEKFAQELNYNNCQKCNLNFDGCNSICDKKYHFNQDEYLRIPEYYYNNYGQDKYQKLIKENLDVSAQPNPINDMIMKIAPHHIITTNYDHLIEETVDINRKYYTVITKDEDIISKNNDRYIIKMHGDIKDIEHIVLKESDYIYYEQNFTLIAHYIKTLLIDHTFLFIGYSLNDYNLKLIIGWINYFRKVLHRKGPKNFIIQNELKNQYEVNRLEKENIYSIEIGNIENDIRDKILYTIPEIFTNDNFFIGKNLYLFLYLLYKDENLYNLLSLKDGLIKRYKLFESYNRISLIDLNKSYRLFITECDGIILTEGEKHFNCLVNLAKDNIILNIWKKAGITSILKDKNTVYTIQDSRYYLKDNILKLYLYNEYENLLTKINNIDNVYQKIYYYNLLGINYDTKKFSDKYVDSIQNKEYIQYLLDELRLYFIKANMDIFNSDIGISLEQHIAQVPYKYRNSINMIKLIYNNFNDIQYKLYKLLSRQIDLYTLEKINFINVYKEYLDIKSQIYDIYFFIKYNYIPIENQYCDRTYGIFEYYVEAILVTYYSKKNLLRKNSNFEELGKLSLMIKDLPKISLSYIDIDIIIKYIDINKLMSFINKYQIQYLIIENDIPIVDLFNNFIDSIIFLNKNLACFSKQLNKFLIILSKINLDEQMYKKTINSFIKLLVFIDKNNCSRFFQSSLEYFNRNFIKEKDFPIEAVNYFNLLLKSNIYREYYPNDENFMKQLILRIVILFSEPKKNDIKNIIDNIVDKNKKCNNIIIYRSILKEDKYKEYLLNNISYVDNINEIYILLKEGYLNYNNIIENKFVSEIDKAYKEQNVSRLIIYLKLYVLLLADDITNNLNIVEKYISYVPYLEFITNLDDFDYSKVILSDDIWLKLISTSKYTAYFKKHRHEFLTKCIEDIFHDGFANMNLQKVVYGLLLDDNELSSFGVNC